MKEIKKGINGISLFLGAISEFSSKHWGKLWKSSAASRSHPFYGRKFDTIHFLYNFLLHFCILMNCHSTSNHVVHGTIYF